MGRKADDKRFAEIARLRIKCKCSHTVVFSKVDRIVCQYCGRLIFKNDKAEFKYRMKEKMLKGKRDEYKN